MLAPSQRLLIIFLKEPIEGKVKTRLAASVGDTQAVDIYRTLVTTLLEQLEWVPDCHYRFCYAPADAEESVKFWLLPQLNHRIEAEGKFYIPLDDETATIDFAPQSEGDLGQRLETAVKQGFDEGFQQVSVIGSDCPFISARWLDAAFLAGAASDVTLGPTPDGGYYLLQLKAFHPAPFRDIPWSTDQTLAITLQRLAEAGLSSTLLPELDDIDTEVDWHAALASPLGARLKKHLELKV